jgi:hypothetical protein
MMNAAPADPFLNVLADRKDVSLRVAAYAIALERIGAAVTPARPAAVIVR